MSKDLAKKKETKRPKVNVEVEVGRPEGMPTAEYIKQLETERDAFKITAENFMSKYLNQRVEIKELAEEIEKRDRLQDKILTREVMLKDVIREMYMYIGWLKYKMFRFQRIRLHRDFVELDTHIDDMMAKAEGLDRE